MNLTADKLILSKLAVGFLVATLGSTAFAQHDPIPEKMDIPRQKEIPPQKDIPEKKDIPQKKGITATKHPPAAKQAAQAKPIKKAKVVSNPPKDPNAGLPLPERCRYTRPEDAGWEQTVRDCKKEGLPYQKPKSPPPTPTDPSSQESDDPNFLQKLHDSEYEKAHGVPYQRR